VEGHFDDFEVPALRPAFSEIIIDQTGLLWIGEYQPLPENRSRWYVFDPSGELKGLVTVPSGAAIHDIAEDYILFQTPNELDIPIVRVHRLRRSPEDEE